MKFSVDDFLKNPVIFLIIIIIGAFMTVIVGKNFATVDFVNDRTDQIGKDVSEIKNSIKTIESNILDIYKVNSKSKKGPEQ